MALRPQGTGKLHDQDAVGDCDSGHHDNAHERHDIQRRSGDQQEQDHAGESRRNGKQDDERIGERSKLGHQNQVDQNDGENQADAEALERVMHVRHRATNSDGNVSRPLHLGQHTIDISAHLPEVLLLRHHVYIEASTQLIVIDLGWGIDRLD
jgi:hypothetical protein